MRTNLLHNRKIIFCREIFYLHCNIHVHLVFSLLNSLNAKGGRLADTGIKFNPLHLIRDGIFAAGGPSARLLIYQ
jgi:hypothetical protein